MSANNATVQDHTLVKPTPLMHQKKSINIQAFIMVFALLIIWIIFGAITINWDNVGNAQGLGAKLSEMFGSGFLSARNLSNIGRSVAITGITAIGMVYVIIAGEIDLSIGSMVGLLTGIGAVLSAQHGLSPTVVMLSVLAIGAFLGTWNGWWIAYRQVPSFIVTLAGMLAFRGLVTWILGASNIALSDKFYADNIANYYISIQWGMVLVALCSIILLANTIYRAKKRQTYGLEKQDFKQAYGKTLVIIIAIWLITFILNQYKGIGMPLMIMAVLATIFTVVGSSTVFGRRIYAMGGNLEATRLSGVNVKKTKMIVYTINGLMAGFAAIVLMSRLNGSSPSAGSWQELYTIAACFIGGTSMRGGIGTVFGALTGALIFESLRSGMQFLALDPSWQDVILGSVLLLAVYIDIATRKKS